MDSPYRPGQTATLPPGQHITPRQPTAPLCVDCKHHAPLEVDEGQKLHLCSHLELRHVVDGSHMACSEARIHHFRCGPAGLLFERRDDGGDTLAKLRLMKAAPRLKAALQALVRAACLSTLTDGQRSVECDLADQIVAAREAIAEAEGRT